MASETEAGIDVGAIEDFNEGIPRVVTAGDRELGIVRWRDRFFAVRNVCAHMGAQVCAGTVIARLVSDGPTSPVMADAGHPIISCPWHGWSYDLATGASLADPKHFRVRSYPVAIVGGRIHVDVRRSIRDDPAA